MWSCDKEKLSIPLEAHDAQSSKICSLAKNEKLLYFLSLLANPAETANIIVRDRELSDAVEPVELRRGKVVVHTCLGWSQAGLLRPPLGQIYRKL